MSVGDVHWVEFPARRGHAQAGRRPAIVVQGRAASVTLPTVLLLPLTSQQDALRFPGTVLVEADTQNGLRRVSVALVFQITAVDNRFIAERLGSVSDTGVATHLVYLRYIDRTVESRNVLKIRVKLHL